MPPSYSLPPAYSLIVIGAGITGLCVALRGLDLGYDVRVISKDAVGDTTSAMAAGMIAPALEAMGEARPKEAFQLYKSAQKHWIALAEDAGLVALISHARPASFVFRPHMDQGADLDVYLTRLGDMGAKARALDDAALRQMGFGADFAGLEIEGEWLFEARGVLSHLEQLVAGRGGRFVTGEVTEVSRNTVTLSSGERFEAAHVVVAGGIGSAAFAEAVSALKHLTPIKGHILNLERAPPEALAGRIIRSPSGYGVYFGGFAKFGASMQTGQGDMAVEPEVVSGLYETSLKQRPGGYDYGREDISPEVGVRASTPDGLPMIGRDAMSGVWVAVGMRRNGWLLAPMAADMIFDLINDSQPSVASDEAKTYDPQRFQS